MNLRITALVYMAGFAAASIGIYMVKYTVQNIQREVAVVHADLDKEEESIHLLKAEWAYLNRPERLNRLAEKHLNLVPLSSKRIGDVNVLPAVMRGTESPEIEGLFQPVNQTVEGR